MEKPNKIIPEKLIGFPLEPSTKILTEKDAILYALGIGFSEDPLDDSIFFNYLIVDELKYTYE
jgi:hypothetical protein